MSLPVSPFDNMILVPSDSSRWISGSTRLILLGLTRPSQRLQLSLLSHVLSRLTSQHHENIGGVFKAFY